MAPSPRRPFCADISAATAEPLTATASRVEHWLLIEYRGLWNRDVLGASLFSERVKTALQEQLRSLPRSRVLFIRRPHRRGRAERMVYLARSTETETVAFGAVVEDPEDLAALDVTALTEPVGHPLLVVCTHGKRDRCCARYGRPLFESLREQAEDDWVWQSTHVGGDRFAGNLVALPDGLYFGRVGGEQVWPLLDEYLAGRVYLDCYRGRSCYAFPVQAAEFAVRDATRVTEISGLSLVSSQRAAPDRWTVRFLVHAAGEVHETEVERRDAELTYLTCDAETLKRPRRFVATSRRVLPRAPEESPPERGA